MIVKRIVLCAMYILARCARASLSSKTPMIYKPVVGSVVPLHDTVPIVLATQTDGRVYG